MCCATMLYMTLDASIPVRLPKELREALDEIAKQTTFKVSDLARIAITEYVEKIRTTGQCARPVKFKKEYLIEEADRKNLMVAEKAPEYGTSKKDKGK